MTAKRKKEVRKKRQAEVPLEALRKSLMQCKKSELVDLLIELADEYLINKMVELGLAKSNPTIDSLVAATKTAIGDATYHDEGPLSHDLDYDSLAYETIRKNFRKLVTAGEFKPAMQLALELMKEGSKQIEMSDEGLMHDDIENCLMVIIDALPKSDVKPADIKSWVKKMLKADRVGCICDLELNELVSEA